MPNDAKLALVIGVGLVVAVGIVFFHKDLVSGHWPDDRPPANVGNPPAAPPAGGTQQRHVPGRATAQIAGRREHIVAGGDTLYSLAERYLGDGERFVELYQANRAVIQRPDRLEVGTALVIPD
jgi:nucleoid-associated protein YgaU